MIADLDTVTENMLEEMLKAPNSNIIFKADSTKHSRVKKKKQPDDVVAIIRLNGADYVFKRKQFSSEDYPLHRFPHVDFSSVDKKYHLPVTSDVNLFIENFVELAKLFKFEDFISDKFESHHSRLHGFGRNCYLTQYVSPHFVNVCGELEVLVSEDSYNFLSQVIKDPFLPIPEFNSNLFHVFNAWKDRIIENGRDETLSSNDGDDHIYFKENDQNEMIVVQKQGAIYAYVLNKNYNTIKVFNTAKISTQYIDENLDYFKGKSYIEAVQIILNFDYTCYPVSLDDIDGHVKSPEYYLSNFSTDEGLIYDTSRGYNAHSQHVSNMILDVELELA